MGKSKIKPKTKSKPLDDDELLEDLAAEEEAEAVDVDDEAEEIAVDDAAEEPEETAFDEEADADPDAWDEDAAADMLATDDDAEASEPTDDEDAFADASMTTGVSGAKGDAGDYGGIEGDEDEGAGEDSLPDIDTGPPPPKAKLTKTTIALLLLNWIAVPAFLYFVYVDHMARVQFAHMAFINYVQNWGLPLREEDNAASLSAVTRQRIRLTPEQLKDVFNKRRGVARLTAPGDQFQAVDEAVPIRIRPRDMSDAVLADVFWDLKDKVPTLEDEIERLQKTLPLAIDNATAEVLKANEKSDEDKRAIIQKTLFSLAWNVGQVELLNERLVKAQGADLEELVKESVQRRLYYDILAPINVFRPGDLQKFDVEKLAAVKKDLQFEVPLDDVKGYLQKRLRAAIANEYDTDVYIGDAYKDENFTFKDPKTNQIDASSMMRDSIEKRQQIGFILFTLSQVHVPALDKKNERKLIDKGIERAQTISGIYEFTDASIQYVRAMHRLERRIIDAIVADREGNTFLVKEAGKLDRVERTNGMIHEHALQIDRQIKIVADIDAADKRLKDLEAQRDEFQKILAQRARQFKDSTDKLLKSRAGTKKYADDLRALQNQLHEALLELSDAADRNLQLFDEIVVTEKRLMPAPIKGGKKK